MTRSELRALQDARREGVRDARAATGDVHEAKRAVSATSQRRVIARDGAPRRGALDTVSSPGADSTGLTPLPGTTRLAGRTARLHPECRRMLEAAGFTYDEPLNAWFNLPGERAIAFDRVADHDPEWLAAWLAN